MAYADKIFKEMCRGIIDNGISTEGQNIRAVWDDGSPAHTIKRFGVVNRYDLSKEFPILTLRKTNWKASLDEILWIFQKQSNNTKDLNSKIWDLWTDENGSIGKAYGYQLQTEPSKRIVEVEQKLFEHHGEVKLIKISELENPNPNCEHKDCGTIIESNKCGKFIILDVLTGEQSRYKKTKRGDNPTEVIIQFLGTGFKNSILLGNAKRGEAQDIYARTTCGVGYMGDISNLKNIEEDYVKTMETKWRGMISRCYNPDSHNYQRYGGKGIFVDSRWHCFKNYLYDSIRLPQYHLAKRDNFKGWEIDKDYYNSNCYSNQSCVWLTQKDNATYAQSKPFMLTYPKQNNSVLCLNTTDAKERYGVSRSIKEVLRGINKTSNGGFTAKFIDNDKIYRYELASNQINDVLYSLKHDKNSRRIMTNFWNPKDAPEKALMECAYSLTFNVTENKLNVILNQRSSDVLLANNWNVVQYVLLTYMIAHVSNLEVGEFVHVIADAHLYTKHIPLIENLINREEYQAPILWINPEVKDFYDFTVDDIKLIDYQHGEQIKNIPIAI